VARRLTLLVAVLGAFGTATSSAGAATICVAPATGGCTVTQPDIVSAVSYATSPSAPGHDTLKLGAITYTTPVSIPPGADVTLAGAGPGSTSIAPPAPAPAVPIVDIEDAGSSIRDLSIKIAGSFANKGLGLAGTADNVSVSADPAANGPIGVAGPAIPGPNSGLFRNGTVELPMTSSSGGTGVGSGVNVEDSTIQAPLGATGNTNIRRSKILAAIGVGSSPNFLIITPGPATQNIESSVIKVQSGLAPPYNQAIGINSRVTSFAAITTASNSVVARHTTIVGDGSPASVGLLAAGMTGITGTAGAGIEARNLIVRGFETSIARTGVAFSPSTGPSIFDSPANVAIAYSDFPAGAVLETGPGSITRSNNIDADPKFAEGDYRLAPGSPAIDAGDPAGLAAGESSTDRDGHARIADGNGDGSAITDMGAFEAPTPPPPPAPVTPAAPGVVAIGSFGITNKVFAVAAKATAVSAGKRKLKRGTAFTFTLDRGAPVAITIARKAKGFRKGRKALKPGSYRATIVASDAAGKSKARTVSFKIVKG
jgi:hypothetical protein